MFSIKKIGRVLTSYGNQVFVIVISYYPLLKEASITQSYHTGFFKIISMDIF